MKPPGTRSEAAPQSLCRTMILCAGFGTRMAPLTDELPKPLLPVGDAPLLCHIARSLAALGELEAVVNAHFEADKLIKGIAAFPIALQVSYEPSVLGVAGGIAAARARLAAPVVVWNGDLWIADPPLEALRAAATQNGSICLAVAPAKGVGTVGLDAHGNVVRLRGERFGQEVRSGDYIGMCGLTDTALEALPALGCLVGDYCLPLLRAGGTIDTLQVEQPWLDIGSHAGYLAANLDWLAREGHSAAGYVHSTAQLAKGTVPLRSVVGAGARVVGTGELKECVVWPGAVAEAPLSNCIVTPQHQIAVDSAPGSKD